MGKRTKRLKQKNTEYFKWKYVCASPVKRVWHLHHWILKAKVLKIKTEQFEFKWWYNWLHFILTEIFILQLLQNLFDFHNNRKMKLNKKRRRNKRSSNYQICNFFDVFEIFVFKFHLKFRLVRKPQENRITFIQRRSWRKMVIVIVFYMELYFGHISWYSCTYVSLSTENDELVIL